MRSASALRPSTPYLVLGSVFALILTLFGPVGPAAADHGEARGIDAICPPPEYQDTQDATFSDVGGTTHEESITCAAAYGIAQGYDDGSYRPNAAISRAQMATFVRNVIETALMQPLHVPAADMFTDVGGTTHADGINAVAGVDVVAGYDDGTYRPGTPVQRGQMATFIAQAIDYVDDLEVNGSAPPPPPEEEEEPAPEGEEQPQEEQQQEQGGRYFDDIEGHAHQGNIERLAEQHIVVGDGSGSFHPNRDVTRGAMATFVMQGGDYLVEIERWFVGATEIGAAPQEGERAENLNHRVVAGAVGEHDEPVDGERIRFEAYRRGPGAGPGAFNYELVADQTVITDEDGLALFSYNGGAEEGDEDRIIICALDYGDEPEEGGDFCAETTVGENNVLLSVTPRGDRVITEVSVTWTAAAQPQPAQTGRYSGEVIALDREATHLDVQTFQDRFRRFDYGQGGTFHVNDREDVTLAQFECSVERTIEQDARNAIDITYGTQNDDRYDLATEADVEGCFT